MSSWSELPNDLMIEVAEYIQKLEDFFVFRAVCKRWFAALEKKEYFKGLWLRQGTPYLMLPVRDGIEDAREFYSLVEREIVASVTIPKFKSRKCFESLGWLLAIENDGSMCLLDPFSGVEIPVPHQNTFPEYHFQTMDPYIFVRKIVLSARPSETYNFILMIICGREGQIGFWRPGDKSWNRFSFWHCSYSDVMYYSGHFYAIDGTGYVYVFDFEGNNILEFQTITRLVVDDVKNFHAKTIDDYTWNDDLYILKTSESLLLISRTALWLDNKERRLHQNTSQFRVYEVNMSTRTWTQINNVGRNTAIFVGNNTTFAIDTSRLFGKIKGNHIYFSDDDWICYNNDKGEGAGKDMGAYNMETGTIESFYSGEVLVSKVCPSIWITPSF